MTDARLQVGGQPHAAGVVCGGRPGVRRWFGEWCGGRPGSGGGSGRGAGGVFVVDAEAGPGFGDDDGVAGVAGVEADLHGEVDADVADVFGEGADVLGALVGDAGDAVAVDEGIGDGVGGVVGPAGLGDAAVDDAAGGGEVFAALALELIFVGLLARPAIPGDAGHGGETQAEDGEGSRRAQDWGQEGRDGREHGGLGHRIPQELGIANRAWVEVTSLDVWRRIAGTQESE